MRNSVVVSTLLAATLCASAASANVQTPSAQSTEAGIVYATGAVSSEDLQALASERSSYSVWITTAAQGSGAYLSDAQVRIADARGNVVLDTAVVGPWLFVDLPAGAYRVEATFEKQTQNRSLHVGAHRAPQQVILYFPARASLSPDWRSPFAASPYASR